MPAAPAASEMDVDQRMTLGAVTIFISSSFSGFSS